jgi:hypothetical protein
MSYSVSHNFLGHITAISDLNIQYGGFIPRILAVGDMEIAYNIFGRVLLIDGHPCTYRAWYSSCMSAVGKMEIKRNKMSGNVPLAYKSFLGDFFWRNNLISAMSFNIYSTISCLENIS